ncbi:PQQ-like beta-propeller repeat protein, partial [Escherichia coli]|nr:PQQ-like beta-propeller repeat protein [Escherichia coli]
DQGVVIHHPFPFAPRPNGSMALLLVLLLWPPGDAPLRAPLALRWQAPLHQTTDLAPAADRDGVYVPVAGGTLVALAARDGQLRWRAELGGE